MPEGVILLEENTAEALSYWGLGASDWRMVGVITSSLEGVTRPLIEISGERYILRRQPPDLTENDTLYRHAFMRRLLDAGLPVPELLPRADGRTQATVQDGIYELQRWRAGERFVSGAAMSDEWLEAAARTLGALHQASADFEWQRHSWTEERSTAAIAQAYCRLLRERAASAALPESIRNGLLRLAEDCDERLDTAVAALETAPAPPELHTHGDYQPHNLGFGPTDVSAIYDFDASRWQRRVDEVAYALLYFTGVRWDDEPTVTPPLVDDGLDILSVHRFLSAYGSEAPPAEGEARLLADALALVFPIVFANGVAEDVIFNEDYSEPPDEEDALRRLEWADRFWLWLDRYRETMAQAWENA